MPLLNIHFECFWENITANCSKTKKEKYIADFRYIDILTLYFINDTITQNDYGNQWNQSIIQIHHSMLSKTAKYFMSNDDKNGDEYNVYLIMG